MKNTTLALTVSLLLVATLVIPNFSKAQPALQWEKSIGGSMGDYVNSVVEASRGGYVFAGTSGSNDGDIPINLGGEDGMIFKLDITGHLKWIKIFGGAGTDQLPFIDKTKDGGYIAIGYTKSATLPAYHGSDDVWVVKTDSLGNLQWQKCYGGSASDRGIASIHQMADGNYLFSAITQSNDGDVSGYHGGGGDAWVVKIDSGNTHNIIWQKCLGGSNGGSTPKDAIEANDGGIVMVGTTYATNGDAVGNLGGANGNGWIVKLNSTGTSVVWERCIGGSSGETFWSIFQLANHSFGINGSSSSAIAPGNHGVGNQDYWFVNLSSDGSTILWQRCFGGSGTDVGLNAVPTSDGKFIATGRAAGTDDGDILNVSASCLGASNYNFWQVKFDSAGLIWQNSLGGSAYDGGNMIVQTSDGGYVIGGETSSNDGNVTGIHGSGPSYQEDAWLVKLAPDVIAGLDKLGSGNCGVNVYPNPGMGIFHLVISNYELLNNSSVEVYNMLGESVYSKSFTIHNPSPTIDMAGRPSGIYLYRISTETGSLIGSGKLVIE